MTSIINLRPGAQEDAASNIKDTTFYPGCPAAEHGQRLLEHKLISITSGPWR